jgi:hypothetical protein
MSHNGWFIHVCTVYWDLTQKAKLGNWPWTSLISRQNLHLGMPSAASRFGNPHGLEPHFAVKRVQGGAPQLQVGL